MTHPSSVAIAAQKAREASFGLASMTVDQRSYALSAMADAFLAKRDEILTENQKDLDAAAELVKKGEITAAAAKRLDLSGSKFDGMIESLRSVAALPDPLGQVQMATELDEGLKLYRVSCPIGVIGMIFESRPDALPQIASLCLKSGNAVLLKGGSEAIHSNRILAHVLDAAAQSVGAPAGWIALLETRAETAEMLKQDEYIDLLIPRGSNEFVRYIMDNTKIPVTGHRDGICHVYLHSGADADKALKIVVDSKCQYTSVCNAAETLLVDRGIVDTILPQVLDALYANGVELRLDAESKAAYQKAKGTSPTGILDATETDWKTEYLDKIISVRVVSDLDAAIEHINHYGSHHTDSIVTENSVAANTFTRRVDSACVFHNASTRFADGFRFGFGAEVGISTAKLHSRGPVGLEGLTIYKYILNGSGQIVADYVGPNAKKFTHRKIKE
ncbi:TPA: glutamate-5-semialdehyde dehydrogenase [Candidatus Sumerlaeota bacterium]|nr:glutamate-5-semialdehyde dehydrogenase [Candidatus Sumerlaeota bacterium]